MENKNIILIGGGGHCKSVIDVAESSGYNILGILDLPNNIGNKILGYPIIGTDELIPSLSDRALFVITVGQIKSAEIRIKIYKKIISAGGKLATIISKNAYVSKNAVIGEGTVIMHNAVVNASAIVGKCCIINTFANIEHDANIGDFCHISTGAMVNGGVVIGSNSFIGSNSMIRQNIEILRESVIGGGICTDLNCNSTNQINKNNLKDIVIVGSGGLAKEVAFLIECINKKNQNWNFLGYIDQTVGLNVGKYKIFQNDEWLINCSKKISVVFGIGDPKLIKKLHSIFKNNPNLEFPNLIHPTAIADWERIDIGNGNIIASNVNFTTDIKIGSFNLFNLSCTIGHDTIIGSYNVFNPTSNISGGILIGDQNLIGTGAQILQYKKIGKSIVIGAGAVVAKDIIEEGVYVGCPAKKIINKTNKQ